MKHEESSLHTKQSIVTSLKKLMNKKTLSKITVSEIIKDCNINRKTFYYHFEDIYGLLKWMLEQEAIEVIKNFDLLVEPEEALCFVVDYVTENHHILSCAYDSLGREEMKRFFYTDFYGVISSVIENVACEIGLCIDDDFKQIMTEFYTEALAGMLINYFKSPQKYDKEVLISQMLFILKKSIPTLIKEKNTFY